MDNSELVIRLISSYNTINHATLSVDVRKYRILSACIPGCGCKVMVTLVTLAAV